jgi:hypothetical protein
MKPLTVDREGMIMCCLVRAIAHLVGVVIDEYGAVEEL